MSKFKSDYHKTKKRVYKKIRKLGDDKIRGLRLVVLGLILIFGLSIYRISQEVRLSFNTEPAVTIEHKNPPPINVYLPRFKTSVDVTLARIFKGVWSIDEQNANYLVSSASPGNEGNIIIYGHNSHEVFGPLRWSNVGDEIVVTNSESKEFTYIVSHIEETTPDDIEWVSAKDTETLTLYTCSGFLNKKRHIVVAYPKAK